ncbi:MAG: lipoyl(octanoyl) transferase LipB [Thermodesulfobacteriota bacterium]
MGWLERLDWGLIDYGEAWQRMRRRHALRAAGRVADALICVEHLRVYTLGKHGRRENILLSEAELAGRGLAVHRVERGGDVTFHGPGQAVVYPIIDLSGLGLGVRGLVQALEQAAGRVAALYGIQAQGDPQRPGVWVAGRKLASIGLAVSRRVTMHGLALNVNTDLSDFGCIRACGLEAQATSLAQELGRRLEMKKVFDQLYLALCQGLSPQAAPMTASGYK